jgi:hypothetical protein
MNERHQTAWARLAAAARRAPRVGEEESPTGLAAPSGFATRVVARADLRSFAAGGGLFGRGFERVAARALGLACACALGVALWGSMPSVVEAHPIEAAVSDGYLDPVGDYLAAVHS